jgi:hypothetical protein
VYELEFVTGSAQFVSRSERERRRWVKLSTAVVDGCLFCLGLVSNRGLKSKGHQTQELLTKSFDAPLDCLPQRRYADAGCDAEWIHELCRGEWGIESLI